jgi:hypothetical protein|tara:strand:+ start:171 stop:458 length:288 start_codon:yes stop_codon:yes gene_type:complete
MTLVEQTYLGLHSVGLVNSREAFSTQYLGKNPNWYSYQTHMRRDFSVSAAVECLRALKQHKDAAALDKTQTLLIETIANKLDAYLRKQHLAVAYA